MSLGRRLWDLCLDLDVVLGSPGFSITDKKLRTGCTEATCSISGRGRVLKYAGIVLPGK